MPCGFYKQCHLRLSEVVQWSQLSHLLSEDFNPARLLLFSSGDSPRVNKVIRTGDFITAYQTGLCTGRGWDIYRAGIIPDGVRPGPFYTGSKWSSSPNLKGTQIRSNSTGLPTFPCQQFSMSATKQVPFPDSPALRQVA